MGINKSDYANALRCPKLAWIHRNRRSATSKYAPEILDRFEEGRLVGNLARRRFPDGVLISDMDFEKATEQTRQMLDKRVVLFEAAFEAAGCRTRTDILLPVGSDRWDLLEVKSSTSAKPGHISDMAYQLHCLRESGLEIRRALLAHVNNEYVRQEAIDPNQHTVDVDISEKVRSAAVGMPSEVRGVKTILSAPECPEAKIGAHCLDSYECPLKHMCWSWLPEHNVTELFDARKKALVMLNTWQRVVDVPSDHLNDKQLLQKTAVDTGEPYVDSAPIVDWLDSLQYPIYNLDFETVNPAIPYWDGSRPYQQVPFQFSIAVIRHPDSGPEFIDYLAEGDCDPRPGLVDGLKIIGDSGTVLAYSAGFERGRLNELQKAFPHAVHLKSIEGRLKDLAKPFRKFWLYHPEQHGQYSIKKVLPAWTGHSYEGLRVQVGTAAMREFRRLVSESLAPDERQRIRDALIAYCRQDTEAMVLLLDKLAQVVGHGKE